MVVINRLLHFQAIPIYSPVILPHCHIINLPFCSGGFSFREIAVRFCRKDEPFAYGTMVALFSCEVCHCRLYSRRFLIGENSLMRVSYKTNDSVDRLFEKHICLGEHQGKYGENIIFPLRLRGESFEALRLTTLVFQQCGFCILSLRQSCVVPIGSRIK